MANLPLYDHPDDVPAPLGREAMRFEAVSVQPYADNRRVKLLVKFPPFVDRPSVDAWVVNADGQVVASMSLIEAMEQDFDFTLHLRGPEPRGEHVLHLALFYLPDDQRPDVKQIVDRREIPFTIQSPY